jgi:hypothetical protein
MLVGPFKRDVHLEEIVNRAYNVGVPRDEHSMITENA